MRERRKLDEAITATKKIESELQGTVELIELAEMEGDEALVDEGVKALAELEAKAEHDKVEALLSGEADGLNAFIEINSGQRLIYHLLRDNGLHNLEIVGNMKHAIHILQFHF